MPKVAGFYTDKNGSVRPRSAPGSSMNLQGFMDLQELDAQRPRVQVLSTSDNRDLGKAPTFKEADATSLREDSLNKYLEASKVKGLDEFDNNEQAAVKEQLRQMLGALTGSQINALSDEQLKKYLESLEAAQAAGITKLRSDVPTANMIEVVKNRLDKRKSKEQKFYESKKRLVEDIEAKIRIAGFDPDRPEHLATKLDAKTSRLFADLAAQRVALKYAKRDAEAAKPYVHPELAVIQKASEKQEKERLRKIRHDVRIAKMTDSTVPFSMSTLLEAGFGADTIRKVYRNGSG